MQLLQPQGNVYPQVSPYVSNYPGTSSVPPSNTFSSAASYNPLSYAHNQNHSVSNGHDGPYNQGNRDKGSPPREHLFNYPVVCPCARSPLGDPKAASTDRDKSDSNACHARALVVDDFAHSTPGEEATPPSGSQPPVDERVCIYSLRADDYAPQYSHIAGAPYKVASGLGVSLHQPLGVWGSFNNCVDENDILRLSFSAPFPLGKPPPIPAWLESSLSRACEPIDKVRARLRARD